MRPLINQGRGYGLYVQRDAEGRPTFFDDGGAKFALVLMAGRGCITGIRRRFLEVNKPYSYNKDRES